MDAAFYAQVVCGMMPSQHDDCTIQEVIDAVFFALRKRHRIRIARVLTMAFIHQITHTDWGEA